MTLIAIAASATTVAMIVSQLTVVGHVRRAHSTKSRVAMLQPLASFVSSILWLKYGLLKNDHTVSLVNSLGVCVSLYILLEFWRYSHARHDVETRVLLALFVSMVCVGFVTTSSYVWAPHVYSIVCCLVSLVFLASPLGQLGQVLRARDASVLLPSVTFLAFANNVVWAVYGRVHGDPFMFVPNSVGAALCFVQLALIAWYGRMDAKALCDSAADMENVL
ncbi:sugar transmembrane transporter activity protein [Coemansia sp. RSA 1822]|nr:sugar transmembrane transporter activity protein [Coemansia sp. RSA 720]KAJ2544036.1 sugar transmembrane transporter activity protein [Coemansia sp. RSA 1853]KAJ2561410.1 sugar transmembrane transporter activity protein [Coemansia sp. RSA 1822]